VLMTKTMTNNNESIAWLDRITAKDYCFKCKRPVTAEVGKEFCMLCGASLEVTMKDVIREKFGFDEMKESPQKHGISFIESVNKHNVN